MKQLILVCLGKHPRLTSEGIYILSLKDFLAWLWSGEITGELNRGA